MREDRKTRRGRERGTGGERERGRGGRSLPASVQQLLAPYFPDFDLSIIRIREGIPWYVLMDADGYTDRHTVYLKRGCCDLESTSGIALIGHEVAHSRQYHRFGAWRFRALYVGHWLLELARSRSFARAYWNIPFEIEAREIEQTILEELCHYENNHSPERPSRLQSRPDHCDQPCRAGADGEADRECG
ncbi:MAG TPA: DUF4157 domain-containing protein [Blastocatellia bacterium]|nr:DUF4157 domain-containing protein [Blastocatellia bacterium]